MIEQVPISDIGTATLGITVAQKLRRNRKITNTTSATVIDMVICTSSTAARMVCVRSLRIEMSTAGGIAARSEGNRALTRSPASMTLTPGGLNTNSWLLG